MGILKLLFQLGIIMLIAAVLFPFLTGGIVSGLFMASGTQLDIDENQLPVVQEPSALSARDYLNLANSYAHANREAGHVCRHIANATILTYQHLLERDSRAELQDSVRLVTSKGENEIGHVWLEVSEDDVWIPYESTAYTPSLTSSNVKTYSEKTKDAKAELNSIFTPETAEYRSLAGTRVLIPTEEGYVSFYNTTINTARQKFG